MTGSAFFGAEDVFFGVEEAEGAPGDGSAGMAARRLRAYLPTKGAFTPP